MIEITTPVGRLVAGHPMIGHPNKDSKTGLPKMQADGITPSVSFYCGLAIAKGAETHWSQTEWGQKIYAEGVASWPGGEHGAATFAWKITDGDSAVPNKKGKKPCEKEGFPGHWIINASNGFPIKSYHRGMFDPTQQIQTKEAIKCGDYGRLAISVKGNNPSESPGVYLNPSMFELYQAGVLIVTESAADPSEAFAEAGAMPAGAMIDPNMPNTTAGAPAAPHVAANGATIVAPAAPAAPGPGNVAPAPDFLQPGLVKHQLPNGQICTVDALKASNWNDAQIAALPVVA